jgi:DNA mismatch repair protein MutS2
MIFPLDFEKRIGFDQIKERLKNCCLCPLGIEEVDHIHFTSNKDQIQNLLAANEEFKSIVEKADPYPDQYFIDPREHFETIAIEGTYLPSELILAIRNSLSTIAEWGAFLLTRRDTLPSLYSLSVHAKVPISLVKIVDEKISEDGRIKDNATPELGRIRKKIVSEQARVRKVIESVLRSAQESNFVPSGTQLSFREGRVVIPVSSEHKRRIKGFIIDESATGQTVYIEPADAMDANNEIRDLQHEEKREEIKVLKEITSQLRLNLEALRRCYVFLGKIDLNRAKAKLAILLESENPTVEGKQILEWYRARHPLLLILLKQKGSIVPLNIELNEAFRFLLISGPNAGGKSVCLKTVGLLQYMLQCGLLVPVHPRSNFGIFNSIFLDIGDQQSIENDLSTYSSHLKNMAAFIANADDKSLVLIDEMGAGTDPNFGGGIAEAVLRELIERGAWGVVTTHYYNLKSLAANSKGIRNAAMLFDTEKLHPRFILEIGKPGSSFAMELARKSNLPESTLRRAEKTIGAGLTGLETLMKKVMEEKQVLEDEKKLIDAKLHKLEADKAKYEKLNTELELRKKEIIGTAKAEAALLLQETNRAIEKTIRHIRENKAEKKETRRVRDKLLDLSEKVKPDLPPPATQKGKFTVGDLVRLPGQELSGTIVSMQENKAIVQFGLIKTTINLDKLLKGGSEYTTKAQRVTSVDWNEKRSKFSPILDLRGKRTDESLTMVDHFLDEAILLSTGEIRILHGKGEGILRKMIREHLKKNKSVASIQDEHVERGGDGISVVVLK